MAHELETRSRVVLGLAAAGGFFLLLPLIALVLDAPWSRLFDLLGNSQTLDAVRVSAIVSLWAALLSVAFGVPMAYVLARTKLPGRSILRAVVTVPLVLPPVVTGVALLSAFGRRGLVGSIAGLKLPLTTAGAVISATVISLPFLVLAVEGALRAADPRLEQMGASLGAKPLRRWFSVTLPSIRPGLIAGVVLAWARALGEFGATITFAGNVPGVTRTLPLDVVIAYEQDPDRAVALSLLMLFISLTVLVGLRDRWIPSRAVSRDE